jgi:hypothetical protein
MLIALPKASVPLCRLVGVDVGAHSLFAPHFLINPICFAIAASIRLDVERPCSACEHSRTYLSVS